MLYLLCFTNAIGQVTESNYGVRFKNDNSGPVSGWLNSGDDRGETHTVILSANMLNINSKYNFRMDLSSTEYSSLYNESPEPRDILFTELNTLQIAVDNNKFKTNTLFFSFGLGMHHIQSNGLTIGATGQKYLSHKLITVVNKYYIYLPSKDPDVYIPYFELKYGYNNMLFDNAHTSLNTINQIECKAASSRHFSGLGAKSYINYKIKNKQHSIYAIDFEFEGSYITNFNLYTNSYVQFGTRLYFNKFALTAHIHNPLQKYLNNPLIKYDDMEVQFIYGLMYLFAAKESRH